MGTAEWVGLLQVCLFYLGAERGKEILGIAGPSWSFQALLKTVLFQNGLLSKTSVNTFYSGSS